MNYFYLFEIIIFGDNYGGCDAICNGYCLILLHLVTIMVVVDYCLISLHLVTIKVVVDYCLRLLYLVTIMGVVMIMFRAGIGLPLTCRSAFLDKYLFLMLMGVRMNILRNGQ